MARIRSVHPGLFTDEAFVSLSDAAQIFLIGIYTECDDQGAFEWKPIQLRLKLRGAKDGSVEPLLDELVAVNCVMSYEHEGRKFGLVRNFRRFQRPKKPNSTYFIPAEFRNYVGLSDAGSELSELNARSVPHQFPTGGEIPPQMEDGGWRMEDGGWKEEDTSASPPPKDPEFKSMIMATWNELAIDESLPRIVRPNDKHIASLALRLTEYREHLGEDREVAWLTVCDKIRGSPFLTGKTSKWRCSFDWIVNKTNFEKVIGGKYDDRAAPPKPSRQDDIRAAAERIRTQLREAGHDA